MKLIYIFLVPQIINGYTTTNVLIKMVRHYYSKSKKVFIIFTKFVNKPIHCNIFPDKVTQRV